MGKIIWYGTSVSERAFRIIRFSEAQRGVCFHLIIRMIRWKQEDDQSSIWLLTEQISMDLEQKAFKQLS